MRTNIEIDGALMARAMEVLGARTKKEAVETALANAVDEHDRRRKQGEAIRSLRGACMDWDGDLDAWRRYE